MALAVDSAQPDQRPAGVVIPVRGQRAGPVRQCDQALAARRLHLGGGLQHLFRERVEAEHLGVHAGELVHEPADVVGASRR
jgi:hypothetical protein